MKFKSNKFGILLRTFFMFLSLLLASYALVRQIYWLELIAVPLVLYLIIGYYQFQKKAEEEVQQFVESVHYRDFTRYFDVKHAPAELQTFRSGFNDINNTFKNISKEKETQFLHLKSILEIVDTGILSYEVNIGEILWMNESLKHLLQIPYLKSIDSLKKRNENLYQEITQLKAGQKIVTTIIKDNINCKILLAGTVFEIDKQKYKLIAFQNINEALDEGESQAWQKLLSVMTHEIMNSVAPISSLSDTLKVRISDGIEHPEQYHETLKDIETGIITIKKRSEGLLRFTETYRSLSKINKVNKSSVFVMDLAEHIQHLMQPNFDQKKIQFEIILKDPLLKVNVDSALIEQVLINLILNAMDAVKECPNPAVKLSAETINQRVTIKVSDNGQGIPHELLDKIFIPFFSTKKTGNGIGLSLCKQVMMLHKGQITVQSAENEGSVFTLTFDLI
jgi:two-component system nitrogen regulation sensor histidine kinase NtrY